MLHQTLQNNISQFEASSGAQIKKKLIQLSTCDAVVRHYNHAKQKNSNNATQNRLESKHIQ
jgi:hypothetical protein